MSSRKHKRKIPIKLTLIVGLILVAFFIIKTYQDPVKTEIVRYGKSEDRINVDGYLIRNETIINASEDGVLSCNVNEGERVKKNFKIATIFSGKVDESLRDKLSSINERITDLQGSTLEKNLFAGDQIMIDNAIGNRVDDLILSTYLKKTDKATQYKDDISRLLDGKSADGTQKHNKPTTFEQLQNEKAHIESLISANRIDLYAPIPGVFSSNIDGFENFFNLKSKGGITTFDLKKADALKINSKKDIQKGQPCVKILDNYEWYFAALVDEKWIKDLKPLSSINLRFSGISELMLSATVYSISEADDGKVAIVASCDKYVDDIYNLRKSNADIIRSSYSGFKVSKSAIRVKDDGSKGVYVVKDGFAKFKNIDISFTADDYVIVKEDNQSKDVLLLYDEVIVSGNNIQEGSLAK